MRVVRWVVWLLAVVLLLLSLAAGALWWWSGTEGSLDWALQRLARTQPLTAEGARGSLRGGIHVDRLAWEQEGLTAEATDVQLEWQPLALLRATLELNRLHAGSIRVEDRRPPSEDPPRRPEALALPLRVVVDDLAIGRFEWVAENTLTATDIAGAYEYNGTQHAVQLRSLRMAGGSYEGNISLGARGAMPLVATLQGRLQPDVPGGTQAVPLRFSASARGPLEDFQAQVLLEGGGPGSTAVASEPAQATATARITPWGPQPVPEAQADLRQLDVNAFWPQAPRTRLAGQVRLQPSGTETWALSADLTNTLPGPWDRQRLPIEQLRAEGEWRLAGQALVRTLEARLGGGRVQASGQWLGEQGWTVQGTLESINPAALHTAMAPLPVGGRAQVSGEGEAIAFDVDLRAQGQVRAAGAKGDAVAAALRALELRQATAKGRWAGGLLSLSDLLVRTADATLQGSVEAQPETRSGTGRLTLQAPGLRVRVDGKVAETSGGGTLQVEAPNVAQAQAWLRRLPGAPEVLGEMLASGSAQAKLAWQGGWRDPAVQATVTLPSVDVQPAAPAEGAAAPPWRIRQAQLEVNGRLSSARLQARGQVAQAERQLGFELAGEAGRSSAQPGAAWRGQVALLNLNARDPAIGPGPWGLALRRGFDLRWAPGGSFEAGAGEAVLTAPPLPARAAAAGATSRPPASQAVLSWGPVRYGGGQLQTTGRLSGLPLQWVELFGGPQLTGGPLSGDLVFDGEWDATLGQNLRLTASLVRTSGDLTLLADTLDGASTRVRAGVRDARLTLSSEGDAVTLALRWDSERAGSAEGRIATRLSRGGDAGWEWPEGAPLSGKLRAQLPRIGVWSLLAPPGWRLRGSLTADLAVGGTRGDPQLTGTLGADDLALRSVVDGVELRDGRLRARLDGRRLLIQEFVLRGAAQPGRPGGGGQLSATGEGSWSAEGLRVVLRAQLDQLRASMRDDRDVTVSGQVAAALGNRGIEVTGDLRIDRALIVIPEETAPRLGSDVVVRRPSGTVAAGPAPKVSEPEAAPARPISVAVNLNMGNEFRVRGRGIDTRLRGTVALTAQELTNPRLNGVITTSGGEYRAYGQRLNVERGEIRFTGPLDNPALDILAIRPNIVQRVGVQISGRAQAPFIRLYSEPEMSEPEKLSWLVLGRSSAGGGAEAALLQQAALALLAARTGGTGPGLASRFGLDELSIGRDQSGGAAVTLGRRFARNFYASYERSLSGTVGTLFLFYELTQRFTLRAEAGERTAVDLIYTLSYD